MTVQLDSVLLACEHKFHCIVGGETFRDALDAVLQSHAASQCPCSLGVCDRAWISERGPTDVLPENYSNVSLNDVVDSYEPDMIWFGSPWDMEPPDYARVNPNSAMNPSFASGHSPSIQCIEREAFVSLRSGLLRCGIGHHIPMRLPPVGMSYADASRSSGVVWIDKTSAIEVLDRMGAPLSLIRRPPGFGKTCFSKMDLLYQSAPLAHSDTLRNLFGATHIWSSPNAPDSTGLLGLVFDLKIPSRVPLEEFKEELKLFVDVCISIFIKEHSALLGLDVSKGYPHSLYKDGYLCIESIRHLIGASGWSLYIVIDNYDAPARAYNNNTRVMRLVDSIIARPIRDLDLLVFDGLILGESCDDDENEPSWLAPSPWNQISNDYTRHPDVNAAFGLSVDKIAWLCKAVSPGDRLLLGHILRDVRGYQFGPNVDVAYGIRDVIETIRLYIQGDQH
ncbi:hypothetical protein CPB85DRAFT_1325229 [Mucidula mucida]|nr:hypothetical protein CPB85DRAFT_1325229 [Mucidula mucida]